MNKMNINSYMPIQNISINNKPWNNENKIIKEEGGQGHKPISFKTIEKLRKALCKIKYRKNGNDFFGTGFFMKYENDKYLLTCYHIISSDKTDVNIELWNGKNITLYLLNKIKIFLPKPVDITIIKVDESDQFIKNDILDILFLNYDLNYINGYHDYEGMDIFNIGYPSGRDLSSASGIVKEIKGYDFYHTINTEPGSSGSPIILFNTEKIIGIHKGEDSYIKINVGVFIGEAINKLKNNKINNSMNLIHKNENIINNINNVKAKNIDNTKNEIIAIYDKKDDEIELFYKVNGKENNINNNDIDIYVNNKKIKLGYYNKYNGKERGKINVKFIFHKLLTNTSYMFSWCSSLISLDLSSFNTTNVNDMKHMFKECESLKKKNVKVSEKGEKILDKFSSCIIF